ncbi:hypothetical protein PVAND_005351 [Polypedilum vanderplanki]|uniref:HMG box domain-containing protein n=1 Tax=Polypedilum vanderplanki TaxID=319348 RepID=A0A9J6C054_POLVA|nr:hypothetical protein PVAND_005351 [Polypedilum vanderplanki]
MARTKKPVKESPVKSEAIDKPKKPIQDYSSDSNDSYNDDCQISESNKSDHEENQLTIDESSNDSTGPINRTKATTNLKKYPIKLKLELIKKALAANKRNTMTVANTLKALDWSLIEIDGYTTQQLQECLKSILGMVSTRRTFAEMLAAYEKEYKKLELKILDAPKKPLFPVFWFINENREMLKELFVKQHKEKPSLTNVNSFGIKYFNTVLTPEEREKYTQKYKEALDKYNKENKEFIEEHPELAHGRKDKEMRRKEREEKRKILQTEKKLQAEKLKLAKKKLKMKNKDEKSELTPFKIFQEQLEKEGRIVGYKDALKMYTALKDPEKYKYVLKLSELETNREKRFSKKEEKILFENGKGEPKKPLTAYNRFVSKLAKDSANRGVLLKNATIKWRELSQEEKQEYQDEYETEYEIWKIKMLEWIDAQPKDQRDFLRSKHHLLATKAKKRRLTMCADGPPNKKEKNEEPSTSNAQKKVSNQTNKKATAKKNKKTASDDDNESSNDISNMDITKENDDNESFNEMSPKKKRNIEKESPTKENMKNDNNEMSPKKNKKIEKESPSKENLKKKNDNESPIKEKGANEVSAIKKVMSNDSDLDSLLSIKKKKFKSFISDLGEYPSLTAAHYFMTKKYSGKLNKVAKAYSKLSRVEKKELLKEANKLKMNYYEKLMEFVRNDPKFEEKVKKLHHKNKVQQEEDIRWHTNTNTDQETDSSSDSDSDSDFD